MMNVSINAPENEKGDQVENASLNELSVDLSENLPPPSAPTTEEIQNSDSEEEAEKSKAALETKESQTTFDQHNASKQVQTSFSPKSNTPKKKEKAKVTPKSQPKKDDSPKENFPATSVSLQKPKKNQSMDTNYASMDTSNEAKVSNRRKTLPTKLPKGKKMAVKRSKLPNTDDYSTEEDENESEMEKKQKNQLKSKKSSVQSRPTDFPQVFKARKPVDDFPSPTLFEKKTGLHDWDALLNSSKSENRTPKKFRETQNIKKLLFPEPSDVDTTYGDFLQEKEKTTRKRQFEEIEDGGTDFSTIFTALQKTFYMKSQKRLRLADEAATKTAEIIQQKISTLKQSRINERKELYEQYMKESKEIQEKSAAQGRKLKASYQKFNAEISQQMKNHVDLANQLIKTKNSFQEKIQHSCKLLNIFSPIS